MPAFYDAGRLRINSLFIAGAGTREAAGNVGTFL